ncbi:MAG: VWA domain-containing protein [bacterium]
MDKSYEVIEYFLRNLSSADKFQLILFNDEINSLPILPATSQNVEDALNFIKKSYLLSGTDIKRALTSAITLANKTNGQKAIVVITDGHPTLNEVSYKLISNHLININKEKIPLFIFGIGNDTNVSFLEELVKPNDGYFVWVNETEDIGFKLKTFLSKIGEEMIKGISFIFSSLKEIKDIYPNDSFKAFDGSYVSIVGRYSKPRETTIKIEGRYKGEKFTYKQKIVLPEKSFLYPHLKRLWAKAKVDYLLKKIRFEGERDDWIEEIIKLSKQYTFVTPYTSFLAAPRSLLRPRVIKPGDPVLRVRCDKSIVDVIAIFPFGLVKSLHYIEREDIWQTRFLAPVWMNDGVYKALLVLTDSNGNQYEEEKSFIIDSKPPSLKVQIPSFVYGSSKLNLKVYADSDTRRIQAKLYNMAPIDIKYDEKSKASLGSIIVPKDIPSGIFTLKIVAEDFAHNLSIKEVPIEIIGG